MTLEMGYLPTNLQAINDLVGGLPVGSATALYGPAMAGKTIISAQLGWEVLESGHNAVFLDTEGSDHTYADFYERMKARFGVDAGIHFVDYNWTPKYGGKNNEKPIDLSLFQINVNEAEVKKHPVNIFVFGMKEATEVGAFLGKPYDLDVSDNGKFMVRPQPGWKTNPMQSAFGQFLLKHNVGYVAVDSVTAVTARQVGTEQQNLPARAQIITYLMSTVQTLTEKLKTATTFVSHEGQAGNATPFSKFQRPEPIASSIFNYYIKYSLYIAHKPNPRTPSIPSYEPPTREMWVARHPSRPPWTRYAFMKLTNDGFVDQ